MGKSMSQYIFLSFFLFIEFIGVSQHFYPLILSKIISLLENIKFLKSFLFDCCKTPIESKVILYPIITNAFHIILKLPLSPTLGSVILESPHLPSPRISQSQLGRLKFLPKGIADQNPNCKGSINNHLHQCYCY